MHNPAGGNVTIMTANGALFALYSLTLINVRGVSLAITIIVKRLGAQIPISLPSILAYEPSGSVAFSGSFDHINAVTLAVEEEGSYDNIIQSKATFLVDNLCISFEN